VPPWTPAYGGEMPILHVFEQKVQKCTLFLLEATDTCVQIEKEASNLIIKVKEINKHNILLRVCSLPMQTQNISSSTHHIESLDTCMEH
jgi:hypothetical protein